MQPDILCSQSRKGSSHLVGWYPWLNVLYESVLYTEEILYGPPPSLSITGEPTRHNRVDNLPEVSIPEASGALLTRGVVDIPFKQDSARSWKELRSVVIR